MSTVTCAARSGAGEGGVGEGALGFKALGKGGFVKKEWFVFLVCALAIAVPVSAQTQQNSDLRLYDAFNQKFLDPTKWATSSPCFTWTVLECLREIQHGQLRLAVRGSGA